MAPILALAYGLVAYLVFFLSFLYAIGFVTGIGVPKTIDSGSAAPLGVALIIDVLLMGLFAVQHSVMARQPFKRWWTQYVPPVVERSTYVLLASLALVLLFWQWQPIPGVVWHIASPGLAGLVLALGLAGWGVVLIATFMISHFELFGVKQVLDHYTGTPARQVGFKTPGLYKLVRHPIYLGFIIAFWAAPTMSVGHLLFAAVTTAYIFVGIALEEKDLVAHFGEEYRHYRRQVAMLIPFLRKSS